MDGPLASFAGATPAFGSAASGTNDGDHFKPKSNSPVRFVLSMIGRPTCGASMLTSRIMLMPLPLISAPAAPLFVLDEPGESNRLDRDDLVSSLGVLAHP